MAENIRTTPLRLRPNEHRMILFIGDLVMGFVSVFAAVETWRRYNIAVEVARLVERGIALRRAQQIVEEFFVIQVPFWFYLLPIAWTLLLVELYEPHVAGSTRKTLRGVAVAAFIGLIAFSLLFVTRQDTNLPRVGVGSFLVYASLLTLIWRLLFIRIYKRSGQMRRILIVGAGKAGQTLARLYDSLEPRSFNIIGFVDDDTSKVGELFYDIPVLGTSEQLLELIEDNRISDLVVAINGEIRGKTFQTILDAQERGVDVTRMPILYEEMTGRVPIHHLESDWIIRSFVDGLPTSGFYELFKRMMDIAGALVGLLILALFFPFIALAIYIDSGLPIFYSQPRLGRGRKVFTIYKFRSMRRKNDAPNDLRATAENDPRVTRVGKFLRKTRLDELPQFWNVLRGDMSLVGPRAEVPRLVEEYQKQVPFYRARLLVKPGLTGWAQINYGYVATVEETSIKLEYDLYYIKHRTLAMDFQIILRTIGTVFRRTGR
ncbi:MAG: sugar transferase [Chloroflexota bacterium]|jgi:exopolysaccharide biosynthesis polyprenyl glycosylphosphotransferase